MTSRFKAAPVTVTSPESALASKYFDQFVSAATFKAVLSSYRQICEVLRLKPTNYPQFYPKLKAKLKSWKATSLWNKLDKRASHKCYNRGKACANARVLIIGAGPCGLRCAIEAQLLGAKVVIVDKRDRFSRNNVLHLWPFVIHDLRNLGAKKFFGKFCAGSIDHISIRQLQLILLKVALLLGVEVHESASFKDVIEPPMDQSQERIGWRAQMSVPDHPISNYEFDVLIGADGKRNTLQGFKRNEFRGKLAIAITANFINRHSPDEARVPEISGVAFIFNQKFFLGMKEETKIDLENIVYYKDDTHYFVMTAKKHSLLEKGVIIKDYADTFRLLAPENVNRDALMEYARQAADYSTDHELPHLDFAVNHYGQADVAMFDFTSMYAAQNACRIVEKRGHKLLLGLVGDSLLEPFWPTGSGCGRGFLSALDMAWMFRSWYSGKMSTFQVLAERESIHRLLAQITPENLNKNFNQYTLNPASRYPNLNINAVLPSQTRSLFDTDSTVSEQLPDIVPLEVPRKRKRESVNGLHPTTLLTWCKRQVAMYDSVYIENLGSSWKSGLALGAIVHRYRPDLIEFESLDPEEPLKNNQIVFDILDKEFGISPLMTGQEMCESDIPDQATLVSYLTRVYETFKGEIPYIVRPCNQSNMEESPSTTTIPSVKSSHQSFLNRISSKLQHKNKRYSLERELNNVRASAIRKRTRELRSTNTTDSKDVMLTCYKKLLNTQEKMSFNSRKKILEEKFRKDAGLHRDLEINGSGDNHSKQIDPLTYNIELLEKQLTHPDSFWITEKKETPKVTKLKKDEWNIKLLEEKLRPKSPLKDPPPERPKVMKDIFENRLQKMNAKLKANGGLTDEEMEKYGKFDCNLRNLQQHLKEGISLDVGPKGQNQVSLLKQHMETLWSQGKETGRNPLPPAPYYSPSSTPPVKIDTIKTSKTTVDASIMPTTKMEIVESCCLCHQLVSQAEKVNAEGLFFHRSCFKCDYCDLNLHTGAHAFDRPTGKFYCRQHFRMSKPDRRWHEMMQRKQAFISGSNDEEEKKKTVQSLMVNAKIIPPPVKPTPLPPPEPEVVESVSNLLQPPPLEDSVRDQTPERVGFENSCVELSEDEMITSELEEEEFTQKNFGDAQEIASSDDEVSDISTDSDLGEEAMVEEMEHSLTADGTLKLAQSWRQRHEKDKLLLSISSDDSDTEQGSGNTTEDIDSSDQYSQGGLTPLTDTKVEIPYLNWKNLSKDDDEDDLSTEESCSDEEESDSDSNDDEDDGDVESEEDKDARNEKLTQIPTIIIQESPPQNSDDQEWNKQEAEALMKDKSRDRRDFVSSSEDDVISIEKIKRKAADFVQNIIKIASNQVQQMEEPQTSDYSPPPPPNGEKYSRPSPPQSLDLYTYNFNDQLKVSTSSSNGPLLESDKSTPTDNSPPLSMPYSKLLESPFQDPNQIFIDATNRMQQCMDDLEITSKKKTPSTPTKEVVSPTSPLEDDCFVADDKFVTIRRPKKKRVIGNDSWESDKDLPIPWCLNESQEYIDLDAILRQPQMQSTPKEGIFRATPIRSTGDDEDPSQEPSVPSLSTKLQHSPSSPAASKYKGYSGSFVEKVRPKSNDGESLYLKSLNINLQKKEFSLLTKSTERLNTNNDFTLSPIVKSPEKDVHVNPIYHNSKTKVSPTSSIIYKPTIDCTMVTPVALRHKNPIVHNRLLRSEPRQSVHEAIEGVPFADEERHNSSPMEETHHPYQPLANGLFRATPQILTRHHSMIQESSFGDRQRNWPKKNVNENDQPKLNPTFREKKFGRPSLSMSSIHYEELDHDEILDRDGDEMDAETASVDGTFLAKRVDIYEPDEFSISKASPSSENLSSKSNFSLSNSLDPDYSPPPKITTDSFSVDDLCTTPTNPKQFDFNTSLQNNPKRSSSETNTNHLGKKDPRPKSFPDKPPLPRKQPSPRSSNKKSIFSLLTFGKNGFSREKKSSSSSSSKDKERSSSMPAKLADKTQAKQRSFPHFKFSRARERGREKQRDKYIVAETSEDNVLEYKEQGNGNALHYQPPLPNHYVTTSQAPPPLYTTSTSPPNTTCSSSNLENGLAPKASEDSFTDEEEQLRISKEDTLFVKTLKSQMAANPYPDKKSRLVAQKVQRQYDMKCLRMAQEIQRQLDELEIKQLEMENQSKDIETECNEALGDNQSLDVQEHHYRILLAKIKLSREKKELYIKAQDLELEHQQRTLQQEIRQKMSMNDDEKTPQDIENEGKILATMLEIVEKRDCLVKLTDSLKHKAEEEEHNLKEKMINLGLVDVC